MRYRNTDGVVDYFKSMCDNTLYVADINEAFEQFEERYGQTELPVLVAIKRTSCQPFNLHQSPYERGRGRLAGGEATSLEGRATVSLEYEILYDVTILGVNNYLVDTMVDELQLRILRYPDYTYDSGIRDVNDPTKEMKVRSTIRLSNDTFGEFEEASDTESSGRIYRTTFSITTHAHAYESIDIKKVGKVPINLEEIVANSRNRK